MLGYCFLPARGEIRSSADRTRSGRKNFNPKSCGAAISSPLPAYQEREASNRNRTLEPTGAGVLAGERSHGPSPMVDPAKPTAGWNTICQQASREVVGDFDAKQVKAGRKVLGNASGKAEAKEGMRDAQS